MEQVPVQEQQEFQENWVVWKRWQGLQPHQNEERMVLENVHLDQKIGKHVWRLLCAST